jgi:hypothetical protein
MTNKHEDTSISLHPLTFEQAIEKLSHAKRKASQPAESGSTRSHGDRPPA